ncbi:hypothetical protein TSAR_013810 [Trichomalopsis sarcophagae]|uniref:F-box domain-containing protein n=1 Tax=Trichomalopsis sarcophagae TaxID=543379 RepID=A0A232ET44_9HYME|nr:hypothetical protein TSAR_013810 [Trichomalopsis sarcophagae]
MFHDIYEENIHSRSYDLINKSKKSSMESYDSGYLSITPNSHGSSYHSNLPLYFTKKSYKTNQVSGYKSPSHCQQNSFKMELRSQKKSRMKPLEFSTCSRESLDNDNRATPDYTGKETVDIFKLLAEKSNHPRIITKILSYLNLQDLCSVTMVSKSWQRICSNDIKAEERRLKYITLKQCSKENIILLSKSKLEDLVQLTPKARYSRKGFLTAVSSNLLQVPKMNFEPDSPPVSPSKVIFNSFIKYIPASKEQSL